MPKPQAEDPKTYAASGNVLLPGLYFYGYYDNVWVRLVETDREIALLAVSNFSPTTQRHDRQLPTVGMK